MNQRGIVFLYRLMLGITIILLGIALSYPVSSVIGEAGTNATCSAPTSDFGTALCYFFSIIKPLFIGVFIFIGLFILTKVK